MLGINVSLLVVSAIAFFLLFRLLVFHIYIKTKGMSTYQYILQNRGKDSKVTPVTTKDTAVLRKTRLDHSIEIQAADDSRDAVNITGGISHHMSKDHTRSPEANVITENITFDPCKEFNRTKTIGEGQAKGDKRTNVSEEPTEAKPKIVVPKLGIDSIDSSNQKDTNTLHHGGKRRTTQKHTLKEDEGSFVLSKPAHPISSDQLASELDSLKPKLDHPLAGREQAGEDKEPGEWTLRQRSEAQAN